MGSSVQTLMQAPRGQRHRAISMKAFHQVVAGLCMATAMGTSTALAQTTVSTAQTPTWSIAVGAGMTGSPASYIGRPAGEHHLTLATVVQVRVLPRLHVGPEMVLMLRGRPTSGSPCSPVEDRALVPDGQCFDHLRRTKVIAAATATVDILDGRRRSHPMPYLIGSVGIMHAQTQGLSGPIWFTDRALAVGGGVRWRLTDRITSTLEYRAGNRPRHRLLASVGVRW